MALSASLRAARKECEPVAAHARSSCGCCVRRSQNSRPCISGDRIGHAQRAPRRPADLVVRLPTRLMVLE